MNLSGGDGIPRSIMNIIFEFKGKPHQIYTGFFKYFFYYAFPVVYAGSVSVDTALNGVNFTLFFSSIFTAIVLLFLTVKVWNKMLKYYSSASS